MFLMRTVNCDAISARDSLRGRGVSTAAHRHPPPAPNPWSSTEEATPGASPCIPQDVGDASTPEPALTFWQPVIPHQGPTLAPVPDAASIHRAPSQDLAALPGATSLGHAAPRPLPCGDGCLALQIPAGFVLPAAGWLGRQLCPHIPPDSPWPDVSVSLGTQSWSELHVAVATARPCSRTGSFVGSCAHWCSPSPDKCYSVSFRLPLWCHSLCAAPKPGKATGFLLGRAAAEESCGDPALQPPACPDQLCPGVPMGSSCCSPLAP